MKNHRWVFVMLLCLPLIAVAQPDSVWTRWFGGAGVDNGYAVRETFDHGLAVAGETRSFGAGGSDFWLIKTDSTGDTLWTQTYGGTSDETCYAMQQTSDSGFILAGRSNSFGGSWSGYLVRTNPLGDTLWTRAYGGAQRDEFGAVLQTSDHGFLAGGYTLSYGAGSGDFWIYRVSATGDSLWSHTFGGIRSDQCYALATAPDGGYYLAGSTESFGNGHSQSPDFWVVKISSAGDSLWSRTFGGDSLEVCYSIATLGTDVILGGYTQSYGAGNSDFWVVKMNASGDSVTSRTFGTTRQDFGEVVRTASDGGVLIAGDVDNGAANGTNFWLIKMTADLDSVWNSIFGGVSVEHCRSAIQTSDGNFAMAGSTYSYGNGIPNVWMVKSRAPAAIITVFPDSVDFGSVLIGAHHDTTLVIHNDGTYAAHVTQVVTPTGFSTTFGGDHIVPPTGTLPAVVRFEPSTAGEFNDTVRVIHSAPASPFLVKVHGVGVVVTHILTIIPDSVNFGEQLVGTHRDTTLRILNVGTATTHVSAIQTPAGFSTTYAGDHAIAPGGEIGASIRFVPDSARVYDDFLSIVCDAPGSPLRIPVRGIGLPNAVYGMPAAALPREFALSAFPNPFNPLTELRFDVPKTSHVTVAVYDIGGRLVETLADETVAAGSYRVTFDGSRVSSGTYFARMESAGFTATQKLVLMK